MPSVKGEASTVEATDRACGYVRLVEDQFIVPLERALAQEFGEPWRDLIVQDDEIETSFFNGSQ